MTLLVGYLMLKSNMWEDSFIGIVVLFMVLAYVQQLMPA